MHTPQIRKVVIVGGGTAGWMTAAALSHFLPAQQCDITLIESDAIGTVGVGEATLPHLRFFNQTLGIDERDFMRKTESTYKMGIEFVNWGKLGDAYIHPFGEYGKAIDGLAFHHYWLKAREAGHTHSLDEYSLPVKAAKANKFQFPSPDFDSIMSTYSYAYHVDAGLYAKYLSEFSQKKGVKRIEGEVEHVQQDKQSGFIRSLTLKSGQLIEGDLFIDCSGFRGLLIEQTLHTGYQDWSHWLPCNSAQAVPCERAGELLPYSRATARDAGWQWRIPLRHRTGNGHVYSNAFTTDQQAQDTLLSNLDGKALRDPIQLRFTTGKRNKVWNKNCIAVGLSSGFLEPLESTSIYLIQETVSNIVDYFPDMSFNDTLIDEFNRVMDADYSRIRDFLIMHYHVTSRDDTEFWNYVRTMSVPDSLTSKLDLYKQQGHIVKYNDGVFLEPSWLAVYAGQGLLPKAYHPRLRNISPTALEALLAKERELVMQGTHAMATHESTLDTFLAADSELNNQTTAQASLYGVRS
jgi:tryptophan halogenase